jgi:hypothetical protein
MPGRPARRANRGRPRQIHARLLAPPPALKLRGHPPGAHPVEVSWSRLPMGQDHAHLAIRRANGPGWSPCEREEQGEPDAEQETERVEDEPCA